MWRRLNGTARPRGTPYMMQNPSRAQSAECYSNIHGMLLSAAAMNIHAQNIDYSRPPSQRYQSQHKIP